MIFFFFFAMEPTAHEKKSALNTSLPCFMLTHIGNQILVFLSLVIASKNKVSEIILVN